MIIAANLAPSKNEARRLVQQGGVRLDDEKVEKVDAMIPAHESVLRVGRLKFVRLVEQK